MRIRIDPLDKLCSEFVRKRAMSRVHGCERCLTWKADYKQLECCHFIGRSKRATRYDSDNMIGCCMGCHRYLDSRPLEFVDFMRKRLGEQAFDLLQARARQIGKVDKAAIELYLEEQLANLRIYAERSGG